MRIACLYTVERGASRNKPLPFAMDIPFGLGIIATLLEQNGHEVDLFVFSESDRYRTTLADYLRSRKPRLVCLTAVSTQFPFVCRIATYIKELDPSIFMVLGGHHASLEPDGAIALPALDAICIGEGEYSAVELASRLARGEAVYGIPHLWIKHADGSVEKNDPLPFGQDLDNLPYIDRKKWEPWINEPDRYPSILLGRGCPFKCTYCSSHAMQQLSTGRFVRFRSPEHIVGEIEEILETYPSTNKVYLEVETIAHQKQAFPLFEKLAEFNDARADKIQFGLNFTLTSTFIRNEERCLEFLSALRRANVGYLNIGLESGSEKLRRDVLRRPKYTNEEFLQFARMAVDFGVAMDLYVLLGVPGETIEDYRQTLVLVRAARPRMVFLSIFYPYLGTDLCAVAIERGLVRKDDLDTTAERARAILDLPGFPRWRIRLEYILFWHKVFRDRWPRSRILIQTAKGVINGSPRLWSMFLYCHDRSRIYRWLRGLYRRRLGKDGEHGHSHRAAQTDFTYVD